MPNRGKFLNPSASGVSNLKNANDSQCSNMLYRVTFTYILLGAECDSHNNSVS